MGLKLRQFILKSIYEITKGVKGDRKGVREGVRKGVRKRVRKGVRNDIRKHLRKPAEDHCAFCDGTLEPGALRSSFWNPLRDSYE